MNQQQWRIMTYIALYTSFQWILEEILEGQPERNHGLMYVYFFQTWERLQGNSGFSLKVSRLGLLVFVFWLDFPSANPVTGPNFYPIQPVQMKPPQADSSPLREPCCPSAPSWSSACNDLPLLLMKHFQNSGKAHRPDFAPVILRLFIRLHQLEHGDRTTGGVGRWDRGLGFRVQTVWGNAKPLT